MSKNTPINTTLLIKQVEPLFKSTLSGGLANIFAALLVYMIFKESSIRRICIQTNRHYYRTFGSKNPPFSKLFKK